MAVTDGLVVGAPEHDVTTQAGFDAILAERGIVREEGDPISTDTSIASGLTTDEPGQARVPETGQFAPAPDTTPTAPDTSGGGGGSVASSEDPEVQSYLAKYGGDVDAAVKAAANQAALLGRQGLELGETREKIARLEGVVETLLATQAAPVSPLAALSADQVEEYALTLVGERGYFEAAKEAANASLASGDERLYRQVISAWQQEDGYAAVDFHTDFRNWQREQKAAGAVAPVVEQPEWVAHAQQAALDANVLASFATLAEERGGEAAFAPIAAHMDAALDVMPENVLAMVMSADPEARLDGLRIVADRATVLAAAAPAPAAVAAVATPEVPSSVQRKLQGSAVATGALRPAAAPAGTPQSREDAIMAFKKELLETETTSVATGLTFGQTAEEALRGRK